ncbi:MAG: GNAT family N-acetyltransferase [Clostridia bacterium]
MLTFVRATDADHDKVRQFLAQFVDDYLAETYAPHLSQRRGGLYLALDGDELVGTCIISLPKAHEAYLSGMRIAPSRQGQGLGEDFGRFQLKEARRLGATLVRVLVHADNEASAHVLQDKLGFRVVDHWAVGEISPIPAPTERPSDAGPAWAIDRERLEAFTQGCAGDLWGVTEWQPESLDIADVLRRIEDGGAAVVPQMGELSALALTRIQSKETLYIQYFRVLGQAVTSLLDYLWNEARAWGVNRCRFGLSQVAAEALRNAVPNCEIIWRGLVMERNIALGSLEA